MATTTESDRIRRLEGAYEHLATNADVTRLDAKMDGEFANLEVGMQSGFAAVNAQFENELASHKSESDSRFSRIEADIARLQTDGRWTRWLLTSVVLGMAYMIIRDLLSG